MCFGSFEGEGMRNNGLVWPGNLPFALLCRRVLGDRQDSCIPVLFGDMVVAPGLSVGDLLWAFHFMQLAV